MWIVLISGIIQYSTIRVYQRSCDVHSGDGCFYLLSKEVLEAVLSFGLVDSPGLFKLHRLIIKICQFLCFFLFLFSLYWGHGFLVAFYFDIYAFSFVFELTGNMPLMCNNRFNITALKTVRVDITNVHLPGDWLLFTKSVFVRSWKLLLVTLGGLVVFQFVGPCVKLAGLTVGSWCVGCQLWRGLGLCLGAEWVCYWLHGNKWALVNGTGLKQALLSRRGICIDGVCTKWVVFALPGSSHRKFIVSSVLITTLTVKMKRIATKPRFNRICGQNRFGRLGGSSSQSHVWLIVSELLEEILYFFILLFCVWKMLQRLHRLSFVAQKVVMVSQRTVGFHIYFFIQLKIQN